MTWNVKDSQGNESGKIVWEIKNNAPLGIILTVNRHITDCNAHFNSMFGFGEGEAVGLHVLSSLLHLLLAGFAAAVGPTRHPQLVSHDLVLSALGADSAETALALVLLAEDAELLQT